MRKMAITGWGEPLSIVETPTPTPLGSEVLVRTEVCGVCHSDVHLWEGFFDFGAKGRMKFADRGAKLPFTLGHEIVGTVAALGPDAKGVEIGESYVVYPWIGCGSCAACQADDELLCPQSRALGIRCDGGYADHVLVPNARYLAPYDGLPKELACTYACSGITAYSALKKAAPLKDSDWLCIVGAGGVGGGAVRLARLLSNAKLLVVDVDPAKLESARLNGADATLDSSRTDAVAGIMQATGGGAAAIVDFVGSGETLSLSIDAARRGGKIVLVGLFGGSTTLAPLSITTKLLRIEASFVGSLQDMKDLLALAQAGKLPAIPIHARPLSEATDSLQALKTGGGVAGRMVLTHG